MANKCALCGKSYMMAWALTKLRGKYNPTEEHKQKPNLQWLTLAPGKRVKACTKCIKALGKKK
jgi:ribosomal protein L28